MPASREQIEKFLERMMPWVVPHDPFTYLVQSRTNAGRQYLVSIAANWGSGKCACPDWEARRGPGLKRGGVANERNECWHVRQAKRYWALQTILATAPEEALSEGVVARPAELVEDEECECAF